MKQAIKDIIQAGGSIGFSLKHSIDEWFSTIRIYSVTPHWNPDAKTYYHIEPYPKQFYDIDEAVNFFLQEAFTSKNVGYIQNRLRDKGIDFESDFDLENPSAEPIQLFDDEGKLVDEEFKNKFGDV